MYSSSLRIGGDVQKLWIAPVVDEPAAHLRLAENGLRFTAGAVNSTESVTAGLVIMGIGTGNKIVTTYIPGVGMVVAPVLVVGEGAIAIGRWRYGYFTDAEFRRSMNRVGVQATGMVVRGTIGAFVGGPIGAGIGMGIGYKTVSVGLVAYEWRSPPNRGQGLMGTMTQRTRRISTVCRAALPGKMSILAVGRLRCQHMRVSLVGVYVNSGSNRITVGAATELRL